MYCKSRYLYRRNEKRKRERERERERERGIKENRKQTLNRKQYEVYVMTFLTAFLVFTLLCKMLTTVIISMAANFRKQGYL